MDREVFLSILAMDSYQRLNLVGVLCALALPLAGCGGSDDAGRAAVAIPTVVRTMMDADFPADGQIHVRSRGKIEIKPQTGFCTYPDSFSISAEAWDKVFAALRQSNGTGSGSHRANGPVAGCNETTPAADVKTRGLQLPNRDGEPYKMVLAVWQGDPAKAGAVWVGGVERVGSSRPDILIRSPFDAPGREPPPGEVERFERYALSQYTNEEARLLSERFSAMTMEDGK